MMDAARNMFNNTIFSARRFGGATYMSYGDAIKLKKLRCGRKEITVHKIDQRSGIETEVETVFYPLWPPYLVRVHNYTKFGGKFPAIPALMRTRRDMHNLWYLISVLAIVPEMWEMANDGLSTDIQWIGWVLTFVAKKCYETKTCFTSKKIHLTYCGQTRFSKN
jgi:hypothetical protein